MKCIYANAAASSGTADNGVCFGKSKQFCSNIAECQWKTALTLSCDGTTPADPNTNGTAPVTPGANDTTPVNPTDPTTNGTTPVAPVDPGVEPSKELNQCTHFAAFNKDAAAVAKCSQMTMDQCFLSLVPALESKTDPTCMFNQCFLDTDCKTPNTRCQTFEKIGTPAGVCLFEKKVIPSKETNVCTHTSGNSDFVTAVKGCP